MEKTVSRRDFMTAAPLATVGLVLGFSSAGNAMNRWLEKPNSKFGGVQIGVITYSYRSMPHDVDQLLQFCIDSNVSAIELMGDSVEAFAGKPKSPIDMAQVFRNTPQGQRPQLSDAQKAQMAEYNKQVAEWRANVSMDKFKEVRKKYNDAGITIYAFKPNAFGPTNTDAEVEYGMRAAKALGANCVTVELPTDPAQTQRLGDLGAKNKVYMGYHNHLQATDTLWDVALAQSPYNSINFDCGHYLAAGGNNTKESLMAFLEAKHDRISTMHLKDRTTKEHGQGNLEWGKGDTPIKEMLLMFKAKKYKFPVTVELEYDIPAGSNAVKEVAKCVAYAKNILVS